MKTIIFDFDGWLVRLLRAGAAIEASALGIDGRKTRKLRAGADAAYELAVLGLVDRGWSEVDARELIFGDC